MESGAKSLTVGANVGLFMTNRFSSILIELMCCWMALLTSLRSFCLCANDEFSLLVVVVVVIAVVIAVDVVAVVVVVGVFCCLSVAALVSPDGVDGGAAVVEVVVAGGDAAGALLTASPNSIIKLKNTCILVCLTTIETN